MGQYGSPDIYKEGGETNVLGVHSAMLPTSPPSHLNPAQNVSKYRVMECSSMDRHIVSGSGHTFFFL